MYGRVISGGDGADFVAGEHGIEQVLLFEPFEQLRQEFCALASRGFRFSGRVEKAASIFRIVQIIAKPPFLILLVIIELLPGSFKDRAEFLKLELLMLEP